MKDDERFEQIRRDLAEARQSERPLDARKLLGDFEWVLMWAQGLLAEPKVLSPAEVATKEGDPRLQPRVWRGKSVYKTHWWWYHTANEWSKPHTHISCISDGDIFLPDCAPQPTEPPGPLNTLAECREIDW